MFTTIVAIGFVMLYKIKFSDKKIIHDNSGRCNDAWNFYTSVSEFNSLGTSVHLFVLVHLQFK